MLGRSSQPRAPTGFMIDARRGPVSNPLHPIRSLRAVSARWSLGVGSGAGSSPPSLHAQPIPDAWCQQTWWGAASTVYI
jgi:hypothetical protein